MTGSWSQYSLTFPKILGPLGIMLNLLSINGTIKPGWKYICWQHVLLNILCLLLRTTTQKKKNLFKNTTAHWHLVIQELWWRCTMKFMLTSCLLIQHSVAHSIPFCSPSVKKSFWPSSLIFESILKSFSYHRQWFLWWIWEK